MSIIKLTDNITKIINVYQLKYVDDKSTGLGDFLRGCFFIRQLSKIINIEGDLDISNHPISNYIIHDGKNPNINYDNIKFIKGENRPAPEILPYLKNPPNNTYLDIDFINEIITTINNNKNQNNIFPLFSNSFPIYYDFMDDDREFIKSKIKPNDEMCKCIDNKLNKLKLRKNEYGVLHIRCGDDSLGNKKVNLFIANKIKNIVNKIINSKHKYLIISDNNVIKSLFINKKNCYFDISNITHLGGDYNTNKDINSVKNTLLDFYLMSFSNTILSISIYDHISGFSKYCSKIYKIPFTNIKI
jgi:hypothetical protein